MKLFSELTVKNLKFNIRKSLMVIIGVTLSVALTFTILTFVTSMKKTVENEVVLRNGKYHFKTALATDNLPMDDIDELTTIKNLGYAKFETFSDNKPYVHVYSIKPQDFINFNFKVIEGRLPETQNEIMVSLGYVENNLQPIKLGDTLNLYLGQRNLPTEFSNVSSWTLENETLENGADRSFKVVGIMARPDYTFENYDELGYSALTIESDLDKVMNEVNFYTLKNPKQYETHYKNVYEGSDIEVTVNTQLLMSLGSNPNDSFFKAITTLAIILILMVSITSIFIIKNSFAITLVERTKEFGILKSLGATNKQVSRIILLQGFSLGLIGLVVGLLLGILASMVVNLILNHVLSSFINELTISLVIDPFVVALTCAIALVTIYFSCASLAARSKHLSPIEAIRSSHDLKINAQEVRTPKYIRKLFNIGGLIAYKNVKRNRKKYRATIASIAISVMLFIGMNFFVQTMTMTAHANFLNQNYNLSHRYSNYSDEKGNITKDYESNQLVINLLKPDDQYSWYQSAEARVNESNINPSFLKHEAINDNNGILIRLNELDEASYQTLLKLNGLDDSHQYFVINQYHYKKDGQNIVDKIFNDLTISFKPIHYKETEIVEGNQITAVLTPITQRMVGMREFQYYPFIEIFMKPGIANEEFNFTSSEFYIQTNEPNLRFTEIKTALMEKGIKGYDLYNSQDDIKIVNNILFLVQFLGYGFISVISLIGLTNIFNSISSLVISRRREYATLMSVGMTHSQIHQMSIYESLLIGVKGLIFGIPLGLLLTLIIHQLLKSNLSIAYHFPLAATLISVGLVIFLTYIIMLYSISKVKSQNIIETIRNENI